MPEIVPPGAVDSVAAQRAAVGLLRSGQAPWTHWASLASQMGEHEAAYTTAIMAGRRQLAAEVCIAVEEDLSRAGVTWELRAGETPGERLRIALTASGDAPAGAVEGARAKVRSALRDRTGGTPDGAGLDDGGPPTTREPDSGPPTDRGGGAPDSGPPPSRPGVSSAGLVNSTRPPLRFPNQRAAGKAFSAEVRAHPQFEVAVVRS